MNTKQIGSLVIVFIFLCMGGMYGCPQYNVYSARLQGEAKLAHAQSEREIQVRDAQGKLEAATYLANAEIERAKGVAKANQIIGSSLKDNDEYLRWLYISHLSDSTNKEVIYIPTEAGLPILEAGKRSK